MGPQVVGVVLVALAVIAVLVLVNGLKIVQEYERGVIFRLGRCIGAKGPGLFFIVPLLDKYVKVSLQMNAVQIPVQQVISADSVSLKVDAFAYMQVVDPVLAVNKVTNWYAAAQ
ncbi:MAG: domain, Band 7 family protein, partial [Frankiales bacterium]|nr:domain, Band 7 family protein [Frankiales bacterium]